MTQMKWLLAAGLCALGSAAAAQDDGKALLERTCVKCQSINATTRQRNDRERWSLIVDNMVSRGAEATDPEIEKIIDYLAKNFGPRINVNKATADELVKGLDLPQAAATAIVDYRGTNGAFKNLEDLKKVGGLDAKEIENKKDRIEF
jgi:competence ComEA-like helix-hairpin-helix protein